MKVINEIAELLIDWLLKEWPFFIIIISAMVLIILICK